MPLINRHDNCVGLRLWKWGQTQIELWFCPKNYNIGRHSHNQQDIEIMFLFGAPHFWRRENGIETSAHLRWPRNLLDVFSIRRGVVHSFHTGRLPMVVLSIERWQPGVSPTSAATDFQT